jgi:hypothetical protein
MSRIEDLLNPVVEADARPQLLMLQTLLSNSSPGPILVPPELYNSLKLAIERLEQLSAGPEALRITLPQEPSFLNIPTRSVQAIEVEHNVFINEKTILTTLYRYPPNTYMEYPETGEDPIGHLFELDPQNWEHPNNDFCYSQGKPAGQSIKGEEITCPILVDKKGEHVFCVKRYSTCKSGNYSFYLF